MKDIRIGAPAALLLIALLSGTASPSLWGLEIYRNMLPEVVGVLVALGIVLLLKSRIRSSQAGEQGEASDPTREHRTPGAGRFGREDLLTLALPAITGFMILLLLPERQLEDPPAGPGDSLHLSTFIPIFSHLFGFLATPDELLELFVRSRLYLLTENLLPLPWSLGLYSYAAGGVYLGAVLWFLKKIPARNRPASWLILFFTPAAALYAGYIENYSMATALIGTVLLIGWRILKEENGRRRVILLRVLAALSGIAAAHHLIAGLMLPALVYLVFRVSEGRVKRFIIEGLICGTIGGGILFLAYAPFALSPHASMIFAESHAGNPGVLSPAGAFSAKNLNKILQILILFPLPLAWVLGALVARIFPGRSNASPVPGNPRGQIRTFLWLAFLPFLIQALFWKSTIGFPADWDLFSFFAGPLGILILYYLLDGNPSTEFIMPGTLAIASVTLFPMLLWLGHLHRETPGTRANLEYLRAVQSTVRPALQGNAELARLPDDRKKTYIRLVLIEDRVLFLLNHVDLSATEREEARTETQEGMSLFLRVVDRPAQEYDQGLLQIQGHLFTVYRILLGRPVHP